MSSNAPHSSLQKKEEKKTITPYFQNSIEIFIFHQNGVRFSTFNSNETKSQSITAVSTVVYFPIPTSKETGWHNRGDGNTEKSENWLYNNKKLIWKTIDISQ